MQTTRVTVRSAAGRRTGSGMIRHLWVDDGLIYVTMEGIPGLFRTILAEVRSGLGSDVAEDVRCAILATAGASQVDRYLAE